MTPSWRKPAGALLILLLILLWCLIVVQLATMLNRLPGVVQAVCYMILGLIWITPLKPLLRWMEVGRWR